MPYRTLIAALLLWAGCCPAQTTQEIALLVHFDKRPAADVLASLRRELGEVFSPAQLTVRWGSLDWDAVEPSRSQAVIVRFHGACAALPGRTFHEDGREPGVPVTLAASAVLDGRVSPFTDVDCDRTRNFLDNDVKPGANGRMGLVLARLMAHEIYHVLLDTRAHSASGLAMAVQSPRALLQKTLRFEHGELEQIRDKLARR